MPRATCAELIESYLCRTDWPVLCCVLVGDRQKGFNLRTKNITEKRISNEEESKNIYSLYTLIYRQLVPDTFRMIPGTVFPKKAQRSTAQHSPAAQGRRHGTARRGAARRCAADHTRSWAELR